jgi:hypothetical protein
MCSVVERLEHVNSATPNTVARNDNTEHDDADATTRGGERRSAADPRPWRQPPSSECVVCVLCCTSLMPIGPECEIYGDTNLGREYNVELSPFATWKTRCSREVVSVTLKGYNTSIDRLLFAAAMHCLTNSLSMRTRAVNVPWFTQLRTTRGTAPLLYQLNRLGLCYIQTIIGSEKHNISSSGYCTLPRPNTGHNLMILISATVRKLASPTDANNKNLTAFRRRSCLQHPRNSNIR